MRPQSRKRSRINSLTTPGSGFFRCNGAVDGGLFTTSFQLNLPSPTVCPSVSGCCPPKQLQQSPWIWAITIPLLSPNAKTWLWSPEPGLTGKSLQFFLRKSWLFMICSQAARVRWAVARKDADISISPGHKGNTEAGGQWVKHGKRVGKTLHFNGGSQQCFNIER